MNISPKCETKKLGMIYTILGSFCSFFNWEGANIQPQIRPRKIPVNSIECYNIWMLKNICYHMLINMYTNNLSHISHIMGKIFFCIIHKIRLGQKRYVCFKLHEILK